MQIDTAVFFALNKLAGRWPFVDGLIIFFASYLQYILVAFFLLLLYRWTWPQRKKIAAFIAVIGSAVVARFVVAEAIRLFYHHPRPFAVYTVHQLIAESGASFPSGHAVFFFAFSAALYGYSKKWGAVFFAASLVMGAARVAAGVHYPSDILGGLVIGSVIGYAAFRIAMRAAPERRFKV